MILNTKLQHQLQSLQSYVSELSDQNEILVQTVEELEREANDRVALVESKLQRTALSLKVNHANRLGYGGTYTIIILCLSITCD